MKALKISTLLIIILIISNKIVSQTNVYKPFPQVYGHWNVSHTHYIGIPPSGSTYSEYNFEANGDTTIGANTYKKVTKSTSLNNPFNFGPKTFAFGYRNDIANKKVYYLDVTGGINKDTLWYNFNLNVGDTMKNTFSFGHIAGYDPNMGAIVTSIDSILICGEYHKKFNFLCVSPIDMSLIEGFGFLEYFIHVTPDCPMEPLDIYHTSFSSCDVGINEINSAKNNIHIYPNPVTSDFKINTTLTLSNYTILNNLGEIVQQGKYTNQESILFSEYLSGLYLISIKDERGNTYHTKFIKQ